MVKTPPFHGGVTSSILVRAIGKWLDKVRALISTIPRWGDLAQLVERHLEAVCVGGSIPSVAIRSCATSIFYKKGSNVA